MSTRLTNTLRERITASVLTHRFQEPVEALIADRAAFAEEVYNDVYRKADREKMAALPAGWLVDDVDFGIQFGDGRGFETVNFSGSFYGDVYRARKPRKDDDKRVTRRLLNKHRSGCVKVYDAAHRLSQKCAVLKERRDELDRQYRDAKRQVEAALASASTINRLVEMWPEVEPFARSFDALPLKVPAVPTDKLNELLDLPVAA